MIGAGFSLYDIPRYWTCSEAASELAQCFHVLGDSVSATVVLALIIELALYFVSIG